MSYEIMKLGELVSGILYEMIASVRKSTCSRTSMARTPLESGKYVRDRGRSS